MNCEINKLANWFRANKMAVNISKTKYLIFHAKGKKIANFDDNSIVFNENEIGKPKDPALLHHFVVFSIPIPQLTRDPTKY